MGATPIQTIATLALGAVILACQTAAATPREVLLLRHGHKDTVRADSNLSPQGLQRMLALARAIPACFEPPTRLRVYPFDRLTGKNARSYQSAVPLAVATGLTISVAEGADTQSEQIGRLLLNDPDLDGGRVVMIWEHRHLPDLARGLGWTSMPAIADDDFDRLDALRYSPGSATPSVVRFSQSQLLSTACAQAALAEAVNPASARVIVPAPPNQ